MARDNNISIGSVGAGNTININQHQTPNSPHIEYAVAIDSVEALSQEEVNKDVLLFYCSLLLPILAIIADFLGILSFVGIQTKWALAVVLPVAFFGVVLTNTRRKIAATKFTPNISTFIDGKWITQESDGSYTQYSKTAPCIYPKCSGTIFIQSAPPREQPNHTFVGVCDVGGRRHTYTVDFNGIGFPAQFDWRSVEEKKSG